MFQDSTDTQLIAASNGVSHKRLRQIWALSPEARLERFASLQLSAWRTLNSNPQAIAAFHARNRKVRRYSNCQRIAAEMQKVSR
jgi:hypothetical protein